MKTFNQFGQPVGEALIDWQPRQHPSRVVLQGRYCRLEPLRVEHAHALFSAYSWPKIPAAGRGCCVNPMPPQRSLPNGWRA
jgi:hypothetical protein